MSKEIITTIVNMQFSMAKYNPTYAHIYECIIICAKYALDSSSFLEALSKRFSVIP